MYELMDLESAKTKFSLTIEPEFAQSSEAWPKNKLLKFINFIKSSGQTKLLSKVKIFKFDEDECNMQEFI